MSVPVSRDTDNHLANVNRGGTGHHDFCSVEPSPTTANHRQPPPTTADHRRPPPTIANHPLTVWWEMTNTVTLFAPRRRVSAPESSPHYWMARSLFRMQLKHACEGLAGRLAAHGVVLIPSSSHPSGPASARKQPLHRRLESRLFSHANRNRGPSWLQLARATHLVAARRPIGLDQLFITAPSAPIPK